jgi:hypothetical protein
MELAIFTFSILTTCFKFKDACLKAKFYLYILNDKKDNRKLLVTLRIEQKNAIVCLYVPRIWKSLDIIHSKQFKCAKNLLLGKKDI